MNIEYSFVPLSKLDHYLSRPEIDSENILTTGLELYEKSIRNHPYRDNNNPVVCLAIVDGRIAGRFMLFHTKLKVGDHNIPVQTGGGLLVAERYRGLGIGQKLSQTVRNNSFYLGALFTRAAYNIVRKTEVMLEIPQYVRNSNYGFRKILDIPLLLKQSQLKKHMCVEKVSTVPDWVTDMIMSDMHEYMEVHDRSWLQWALDNNASGNPHDYQSFYAVYDNNRHPLGFFMTKVRHLESEGVCYKKANLVEWSSVNMKLLDEADINLLALGTLDSSVSKFWTISNSKQTESKLAKYFFHRKGWFAMSVTNDGMHDGIGDSGRWRIRYGCANTPIV